MKPLAYSAAVLALVATAGMSQAQNATTPQTPANQPSTTAPADCPAPGSVPDAQLPENCKTNLQQPTQNNDGTSAQAPAPQPGTATSSTAPMQGMDPANSFLASNFIGQTVYSAANENVGEINDIVMDKANGAIVAIVGVGGFLGIGEKDVAMPIDQISVAKTDTNAMRLTINSTRQQLEAAPAFDRNVLTMNNGGTQIAPGAGTTGTGTTTSQ
jgi:sporulation protein YlmC with PRC-barrel domain